MFIVLLLLWLIFAGSLTVTNLILGVIVSALITFFCSRFMGYSTKKFFAALKKSGQLLGYLLVLLREIVTANIAVLKMISRRAGACARAFQQRPQKRGTPCPRGQFHYAYPRHIYRRA